MMKSLLTGVLLGLSLPALAGEEPRLLQLEIAAGQTLLIPVQALQQRNGISGVFVAYNGEARFRMVRPGTRDRRRVTVLSGLFGDETLVLGKADKLYDGMPLADNTSSKRSGAAQ